MTFRVSGACCAMVLSVCLAAPTLGADKQAVEPAQPPLKVLLLPVDFDILEMSAGGMIEPVPEATTEAEAALLDSADRLLRSRKRFQVIDLPAMSEEEKVVLKEHVALYKLTAVNAATMMKLGGAAWKAKQKNFDYSVGDGLKFLIERSGADAAVVVAGAKVGSSGGRVAMMLLLAAAGVIMPGGGAQITAGVIDLDTGRIQWLDERSGLKGNVREKAGADLTMRSLLGPYPASALLGIKSSTKKR